MPPLITVIIATYHRPEALSAAIQSVRMQTEGRWQLLVIGDYCTDATESTVRSFDDPRIHFVNLPSRCMEQALPNSIGMLLAESPYIALLNHDDMWLPDHLEHALAMLEQSGAEWYAAHAAVSRHCEPAPHGTWRPFFTEENPPARKLSQAFGASHILFEPASAWVFKRSLIEKAGLWRSTLTIHRTPIQDWVIRAWRKRVRFVAGDVTTVLKFGTHYKSDNAIAYQDKASEQHYTLRFMQRFGADAMRKLAARQIAQNASRPRELPQNPWTVMDHPSPKARRYAALLLNPFFAWLYYATGIDSYALYCRLLGITKASLMMNVTRRRTGEEMRKAPDFDILLRYAKASMA